MKLDHFRLIAAPFTPMNSDGSLNRSIVPEQAAQLVFNGVRGAFLCGTTGEGQSLAIDERIAVVDAWSDSRSRPNLLVFVHRS
jgi:N-acetylneuraminate lyase